jgi:hypothetical protein
MGDEEIRLLLIQLRAAVRDGGQAKASIELIDRLEAAVDRVVGETEALRARLERPLTPGVRHAEPERLEAWVRKLERPETTAQ